MIANANQKDTDRDWVGDKCDNCPLRSNSNQKPVCIEDPDYDGKKNECTDITTCDATRCKISEDDRDTFEGCETPSLPRLGDALKIGRVLGTAESNRH